ncbi:IclR family transcriptional regulator [soil metagenome]
MAPAPAALAPAPLATGDGFVQSFARGLSVIRSFSSATPAQTLSEVAAQTGMTRAGARRILLTLAALDYVIQSGRQFRLTPKVLELGFAYLSSMPMWNIGEPIMERLSRATGESCSIAVLDATEIVYVQRVHTQRIMALNLSVGSRLPASCTALGRVLLAGLPPKLMRARLEASERVALTPRTITQVAPLVAKVEAARTQGYALVDQELELGLISLAAPITDNAGNTIAALNVSAHASGGKEALRRRILPLLLDAAHEVSQRLPRSQLSAG